MYGIPSEASALDPTAALTRPAVREAGRPLRAWSAAVKRHLARALDGACNAWLHAWGLSPSHCGSARCLDPFEAPAAELSATPWRWQPAGPGLWWAFAAEASQGAAAGRPLDRREALARALFGEPALGAVSATATKGGAALGGQVADDAWSDWWRLAEQAALGKAPAGAAEGAAGFPTEVWKRWEGALLFELPWAGGLLRVISAAERLERTGAQPPRPARQLPRPISVWRAAAASRVQLRVETQPFEVDLGALAGLSVGDVLRTSHPLEAPLSVRMEEAACADGQVCAAWLGRAGGWRAAGLRAANPAPEPALPGMPPAPAPRAPFPTLQPQARIP